MCFRKIPRVTITTIKDVDDMEPSKKIITISIVKDVDHDDMRLSGRLSLQQSKIVMTTFTASQEEEGLRFCRQHEDRCSDAAQTAKV